MAHTAPAPTAASSRGIPIARAASASGASVRASTGAPTEPTAAAVTARYSTNTPATVTRIARGIVRRGSRTSSPRVATRA